MPKSALLLMVKNEEKVIERCLQSALLLVDGYIIVDTGSTDSTKLKAATFLQNNKKPFNIYDDPWKDFATNRTNALRIARNHPEYEYVFFIDADEVLSFRNEDAEKIKAQLGNHDCYNIYTNAGTIKYHRPQVFRNSKPFLYEGVVHEFAKCEEGFSSNTLTLVENIPFQDSYRNISGNKVLKDIDTLTNAITKETQPYLLSRYYFYLAQSLFDVGRYEHAMLFYAKRLQYNFWMEECFYSLYRMAMCMERLQRPNQAVIDEYFRAVEFAPQRAEPLARIQAILEKENRKYEAALVAKRISEMKNPPPHGLFVEPEVYGKPINNFYYERLFTEVPNPAS